MNAVISLARNAYEKARECAPQPWLVAALLAGVLDHLQAARKSFCGGQRAECMVGIGKATAILQGLRENLRPEVSKKMTSLLDTFYTTNTLSISRLVSMGFEAGEFDAVVARIQLMHDAWSDICIREKEPT